MGDQSVLFNSKKRGFGREKESRPQASQGRVRSRVKTGQVWEEGGSCQWDTNTSPRPIWSRKWEGEEGRAQGGRSLDQLVEVREVGRG